MLNAVLAPSDTRGLAFLIQNDPASDRDTQWLYLPAVRRVRKLVAPEAYEAFLNFLNSEFTYADLGFLRSGRHASSSVRRRRTA